MHTRMTSTEIFPHIEIDVLSNVLERATQAPEMKTPGLQSGRDPLALDLKICLVLGRCKRGDPKQ